MEGVLEKSLYQKAQIELGLEERFDAIDLAWEVSEQSRKVLSKGTKVITKFGQLGRGRTLLILGDPGSGKTTTLLEIAYELVERSEQNVDLPIPVIFNLSSWTNVREKMADWLVLELITKYQVSRNVGQNWIGNQELILLLDGLDEVVAERREACVTAINQFSRKYGQTEIVVCSRVRDYESLSLRLQFQGALFVQPLTFNQIDEYLDRAGLELAGVKTALQTDAVLRDLVKTPLMLSIVALAYQRVPFSELPKLGLEEQRKYLFDAYIRRMFRQRHNDQGFSRRESRHWLVFLAQKMSQTSQTEFLIERIQPNWLSKGQISIYSVCLFSLLLFAAISFLEIGFLVKVVDFSITQILFGGLSNIISYLAHSLLSQGSHLGIVWIKVVFPIGIGLLLTPLILLDLAIKVIASFDISPAETIEWSWKDLSRSVFSGLLLILKIASGISFWKRFSEALEQEGLKKSEDIRSIGLFLGMLIFG